ncbi:hypothetical protein DM872_22190 [Pseudomonas taiwanensis]|uniref:DUF7693 family protein n=1 Tax=Pseudomonas taiwanensis TaxID=470150 RepID=UPI0015BFD36D|nr:hypothetical protein [Pseudomonas taiwanensis]NWL79564.1 hypothetical protein [Pseudomonas taiwanensis]
MPPTAHPQQLSGHEVAQLLREAIAGRLELRLDDPANTWQGAYCGLVAFRVAGWRLQFFNDCDSLDYCNSAESPDGRTGTFEIWFDADEEPVALLGETEQRALAELLDDCA